MRIVRIVVFGIAGILLGYILLMIADNFFQSWQELSTSPDQTIELVPGSTVEIFSPESWASHPGYMSTKPCDYSSPEFSWYLNRPKDIQDCIQVAYANGPEYLIESTYVMDTNGKVWKWPGDSGVQDENRKVVVYIASGFIIGGLIAVVLNRRAKK